MYLQETNLLQSPSLRLLDVAPSTCFATFCKKQPNVHYFATNLGSASVHVATDLTQAGLRDRAFDVLVCFHVLEHIPDDLAAMKEIRRLLRPGGTALIQVPLYGDRSVDGPDLPAAERVRRFGQEDHVRSYGWDIVDRLGTAGLAARIEPVLDRVPKDVVRRFALDGDDRVIIVAEATSAPSEDGAGRGAPRTPRAPDGPLPSG